MTVGALMSPVFEDGGMRNKETSKGWKTKFMAVPRLETTTNVGEYLHECSYWSRSLYDNRQMAIVFTGI